MAEERFGSRSTVRLPLLRGVSGPPLSPRPPAALPAPRDVSPWEAGGGCDSGEPALAMVQRTVNPAAMAAAAPLRRVGVSPKLSSSDSVETGESRTLSQTEPATAWRTVRRECGNR